MTFPSYDIVYDNDKFIGPPLLWGLAEMVEGNYAGAYLLVVPIRTRFVGSASVYGN
jgi:hypothetical protein